MTPSTSTKTNPKIITKQKLTFNWTKHNQKYSTKHSKTQYSFQTPTYKTSTIIQSIHTLLKINLNSFSKINSKTTNITNIKTNIINSIIIPYKLYL